MSHEYEAPEVKDLGSLSDLTLQGKTFGPTDGYTFQGQGLQNT